MQRLHLTWCVLLCDIFFDIPILYLTLKFQEINEVSQKVNAVCKLLPHAKPTGRTIYNDMDSAMDLQRAIWRGAGFWEWCKDHTWEKGEILEPADKSLFLGSGPLHNGLPVVDFAPGNDPQNLSLRTALLENYIVQEERASLLFYLNTRLAGIGGVNAVCGVCFMYPKV